MYAYNKWCLGIGIYSISVSVKITLTDPVAKSKEKTPDILIIQCLLLIYKYDMYVCFCIPESFNTNISHQLFDYTITFVNPQH